MIRTIGDFFKRLLPTQAICVLAYFSVAVLTQGCSNRSLAPVADLSIRSYEHPVSKPIPADGRHIVRRGETLFSIAWRYGIDYKKIAIRNQINTPYRIFPGQRIALDEYSIKPLKPSTESTKKPKNNQYITDRYKKPESNKKEIHKKDSQTLQKSVNIDWMWPVDGEVIKGFSVKGIGNKGLDLSGNRGDQVKAAGAGKVVYSGSGLRGYGKLIIIKHNDVFLSAYAHNSRIIVKEGDVVKAGEKIAEIGSSDASRDKLHFEIRRQGKPVNPVRYLPKR